MYKNLILLFICFLSMTAIAQVPQAINYQAVARNNSGQALVNQTIKVRLSIMQGATSLYSETRSVTTNALGLFNVKIGSPGAIATTGGFTTIQWVNNIPEIKQIKVELDVNSTNTFTDMGTQSLATVPYAFAASEAINALNIGGNYVDTNTPVTGDLLKWNGLAWAPAPPPVAPAIHNVHGQIYQIDSGGGGGAPWVIAGPSTTVTVTAGQTITANFVGVFGHGNNNPQPCSFSVCYEPVVAGVPAGTGVINSFHGNYYTDGTVEPTGNKTELSATGAISLPAGTYRIFMGFKNKSTNVNFGANDFLNGTIIVF